MSGFDLRSETMNPEALRAQLSKLHEDLKSAPRLDPQSHQLLSEVLKDIQRLLEADSGRSNASLADRLERVAVRFEADHPTLASSSRRLIDLLGKAGL
jgi:predicted component of type VI protein secretion system